MFELPPRLRVALQDRGCKEGPRGVYTLGELAADLRACACVCGDVGIEGIHGITHLSEDELLDMLVDVGLDILKALRSVSVDTVPQLHEFIPVLSGYAPNVTGELCGTWLMID